MVRKMRGRIFQKPRKTVCALPPIALPPEPFAMFEGYGLAPVARSAAIRGGVPRFSGDRGFDKGFLTARHKGGDIEGPVVTQS